jgi:transposase
MNAASDVPDDKDALKAALIEARAKLSGAVAMIEHLHLVIAKMKREMFGPRSERSQRLIDQLELQLEELAADVGEDAAQSEAPVIAVQGFNRRKSTRRNFPDDLPRRRIVHPMPATCPCCGGDRLSKIGEDVTETLDVVPRQFFVTEHVREKFSCRTCETITQPPAPFHAIPRGFAGTSLLAMILVEKYANHQPLNRQSEQYAREGSSCRSPPWRIMSGPAQRSCGPVDCGPICATISHSAAPPRQPRCTSTRLTAVASIPSGISLDMPGFSRLTHMRASTRSASRSESQVRSSKQDAGRMQDGNSSSLPTSPRRRAARQSQ